MSDSPYRPRSPFEPDGPYWISSEYGDYLQATRAEAVRLARQLHTLHVRDITVEEPDGTPVSWTALA